MLQQFLSDKGYFSGSIDGSFSSLTKKAVATFQKNYGVLSTGFFGPTTRKLANYLLNPIGAHAVDSGLIGYWNFNEGVGSTVSDSSTSSNKGTLVNSPTWVIEKTNPTLMFDGVRSYVSTKPNIDASKGSISVWVNTTATLHSGKIYTIFSSGGTGNLIKLSFNGYDNGGDWEFSVRGSYGSTTQVVSQKIASNTALGGWHHLVATWNTTTGASLYVDGRLVQTVQGKTGPFIGTYQTISHETSSFKGQLDEVKLYNKILTDTEVSVLYAMTNSPLPPNTEPNPPSPSPIAGSSTSPTLPTSTSSIPSTPTSLPSLTFSSSLASITSGSSAVLSWSSIGAVTCTASGGWVGSKTLSGSMSVAPKITTTYTVICTNSAGVTTKNVTITVKAVVSSGTGISAGLLGYWPLDTISGIGTNDYSGNNGTGVLMGNPILVAGKIGNSLEFNGRNSYVATPVTTNGTTGSVSLWVNPTTFLGTARTFPVFTSESLGSAVRIFFDSYTVNKNPWTVTIRGNYGKVVSVTSPVASNTDLHQWQHIVATWDVTKGVSLYVNGVLKATSTGTTNAITNLTQAIGSNVNSFLGDIDEVRTYDRVLSQGDISTLYMSRTLAIAYTGPDTVPPTIPVRLTGNPASLTAIDLTWKASADNVAVTGYKVYRNNVQIGTAVTNSYTDIGLIPNTLYNYSVTAYDAVGNMSAPVSVSSVPSGKPSVPLVTGINGPISPPQAQPIIPETALRISESKYSGTTWKMIAYSALPWIHAGGDWRDKSFVLQGTNPWSSAVIKNNKTEQKITFDVTSLVANQIGDSSQKIANRGWFVKLGAGTTIGSFHTKEALDITKRPILHVVTSVGVVDIPVGDDVGISLSTLAPRGDAATISINANNSLVLWVDLSRLRGTVTSAVLTLTTTNTQYGGISSPLSLFPVDLSETFAPIPVRLGIASKYKDDIGLEKDPDVIFMERYPDTNLPSRGWDVDVSLQKTVVGNTDPADSSYVPLANGIQAFKMTVPKGTYGGSYGRWLFWSNLGYEPEEVYMRTYARMGGNFDSMAGKFPFGFDGTYAEYADWRRNPATGRMLTRPDAPDYAGNGGATSNGTNGWSARGGYAAQDCDPGSTCLPYSDTMINPFLKAGYRKLDYYVYWADQPDLKGSVFLWDKGALGLIPKNKWFAVDQYTKLNTVNADGTGNKDGILRVWIDGRLAYENTQFRVRNWPGNKEGAKNIKISSVWLDFFNGGLNVANSPLVVYLSNTVISKSFIGPSNAR